MNITQGAGKSGKPATRPRGPRGLALLVGLLLPAFVGGGIGALEIVRPDWWTKLTREAKAAVLVGIAVVARIRKMPELYGGAIALAGHYVGQIVAEKVQAARLSGGTVAGLGLLPTAAQLAGGADEEMRQVYALAARNNPNLIPDETVGVIPEAEMQRELSSLAGAVV